MQTTMQMLGDMTWHMILPLVCLTYGGLAAISRYARTGLLDVIRSDYVRTARAKGLPEWIVIMKHAVRNGLIPILTLLGFTLPALIGGSIIIEHIFAIDGMGKLMITAIQFRDYNVIMGELLIAAVLTLLGILLSDISYALVDPRISLE
jgi:peptide/nickel transport system permease protein